MNPNDFEHYSLNVDFKSRYLRIQSVLVKLILEFGGLKSLKNQFGPKIAFSINTKLHIYRSAVYGAESWTMHF